MPRNRAIRDATLARQLQADQRARGVAMRLDATITAYWPYLLAGLPVTRLGDWNPKRFTDTLAIARQHLQSQLYRELITMGEWAGETTVRALRGAIRRHPDALAPADAVPLPGRGGRRPPGGGGRGPAAPAIPPSGGGGGRFIVGGVIEPPSAFEIARIVGPAPARLTKLFDVDRVSGTVWSGIAQGDDRRKIAKTLQGLLDGDAVAARRVARTEGLRVATAMTLQTSEQLGEDVSGYQIHAVLDSRTRPEHRNRNGTIYWRHPNPAAGEKGFDAMPQPPIEADGTIAYNCRCFLAPVFRAAAVPAPMPMPERELVVTAAA